jgi:hypothetical protein
MSDLEQTISKDPAEIDPLPHLAETWDADLARLVCERCDWTFLAPASQTAARCPHCHQAELTPLNTTEAEHTRPTPVLTAPDLAPPEQVIPFSLSPTSLESSIQSFARGIPYAPDDLNPRQLRSRLQAVFLPMWLVDAKVQATWQAEAGFNYEVVSHQDKFEENRGGWSTRQVNETKTRWEPRLGRLQRNYQNIRAPALEEHNQLQAQLGPFDLDQAQPYQKQAIQSAMLRLPDRTTQDAWPDAKPAFQQAAVEECRQAIGADYVRSYSWQAEFHKQNWTLLLLPVYTTYYLDDEHTPRLVLIHGQSGKLNALRRASLKRAQRTAITLLVIAAVLFLLSLAISTASIFLPPALAIGVLGIVAALLVGLGALIPVATVWWFNRSQTKSPQHQ